MDETRFDDLSRSLSAAATRRAGLKAALGALLGGAGVAAASRDADAKRRRRRCRPACGPQQSCVNRQCTCPSGGTVCGANCCLVGQACQGGQCVAMPDPGACVGFGQVCKNVGVPCCEGFVCGSGQGGEGDVACYVPAGGACATTGDCTFGSQCLMGLCAANVQPGPQPTPIIQCTPSIPVTGNPATDGAALKQAFADAALGTNTTISLGTGDYLLEYEGEGGSEDASVVWDSPGNTVTVRACPGADARMKGTADDRANIFKSVNGTMELVGPGLSLIGDGSTIGLLVAGGSALLQNVAVEEHGQGIYIRSGGTVEINGGSIEGAEAAIVWDWRVTNDPTLRPDLTCSPDPTVDGACHCATDTEPTSGDNSCPINECCDVWCRLNQNPPVCDLP